MTATHDSGNRSLLLLLGIVAFTAGLEGSIISATLTYAADEWNVSTATQSRVFAFLRADIVIALVAVRLADRVGRRKVLLIAATLGPLLAALSGATTALWQLALLQLPARAMSTTAALLIAVYVAEEFPANRRTRGTAFLIALAAVGSGIVLGVTGFTDRAPVWWWRVIYFVPLLSLAALPFVRRTLPESKRFARYSADRPDAHARSLAFRAAAATHRTRLLVTGLFALLIAFETTPTRQLQNEYLREERDFSSSMVSVFGVVTNAPGLLGLIAGGVLADRFGRRRLLTIGFVGFAVFDAALFLTDGTLLWAASFVGAMVGGAALPSVGVYAAELFPTPMRSTADGVATAFGRIGGALGLLFVSVVAVDQRPGVPLALTTIATWLALIVLRFLPETAGRELEQISDESFASELKAYESRPEVLPDPSAF